MTAVDRMLAASIVARRNQRGFKNGGRDRKFAISVPEPVPSKTECRGWARRRTSVSGDARVKRRSFGSKTL